MSSSVPPIPPGFHTLTPYLHFRQSAADAIEFYERAFGAVERFRLPGQDGERSVGHAEIVIGDSIIMLADEPPCPGAKSPQTLGGSTINLVLYVEDCDAFFARALAAGATETQPLEDKFYGDRAGGLIDPFGYHWSIMTHREDLTQDEINQRLEKLTASQQG